MHDFLATDIIRKKRDGLPLSDDEIEWFIEGIPTGAVPDYQTAAMLMAVFFRGLDDRELAAWTKAEMDTGDIVNLDSIDRPCVDKHSTGGVGDGLSLILAPAAAACGMAVPMLSGRSLGHTGGTLDKLEAIPGFTVEMDLDRFVAQVRDIGVAIIEPMESLAPAEKILYALNDVTATLESIPIIAASIMCKKLAEGIDGLVLDVKQGRGAFMKTRAEAVDLAERMRAIGAARGKKVTAVLDAMDEPLGEMVGNALEIEETVSVLKGEGSPDMRDTAAALGAEMLLLAGLADSHAEALERFELAIVDGSGLDVFRRMVEAQGGDPRVVDDPKSVLAHAERRTAVQAPSSGYVADIDGEAVGMASLMLGAGRKRAGDAIDPAVGIEVVRRIGDQVESGRPLVFLHENSRGAAQADEMIRHAYDISPEPPETVRRTRILEVIR